jgi:hypothetical protein
MITKEQIEEVILNIQDLRVMPNHLLVLLAVESETTESGIIKGEAMLKEDTTKEAFLSVVKVGKDVEGVEVFDRVFIQGNNSIIAFTEESGIPELDVAPEGYSLGLVASPYIKMYLKSLM